MKAFRFVYAGIGIVIIGFCIFLGTGGLPENSRQLYHKAVGISNQVQVQAWPGFDFSRYPAAIRRNDTEYVLFKNSETSRSPALPVMACTAYRVKGEMNIFVVNKDDLSTIGQFVEGLSESQNDFFIKQFALSRTEITDNRYIAILYHEGLHAFQMDLNMDSLNGMLPADYEDQALQDISDKIDSDPELTRLYQNEAKLLYNIASADGSKARALTEQFLFERSNRQQTLKARFGQQKVDDFIKYENFYEMLEGTARYMETEIANILGDDKLYDEYLLSLQEKAIGREKYYRSGMGICLALDKCDITWKKDLFLNAKPLQQILSGAVKD